MRVRLKWKSKGGGYWSAFAGVIELKVYEGDEPNQFIWTLGTFQNTTREDAAETVEAAQVAAEAAAFQVLREGLRALEGLAVAPDKAALVVDALYEYGCSPEGGYPHLTQMRALAKELEGDLKGTAVEG